MTGLLLILALVVAFPKPAQTPGMTRPLTKTQICSTKWGKDRRHVTEAMKTEIARRYGLTRAAIKPSGQGPCCEVDHLIPRELGGADDVKNLWPQPWTDAHQKDQRENALHVAVCQGSVSLAAAQDEMRAWGR